MKERPIRRVESKHPELNPRTFKWDLAAFLGTLGFMGAYNFAHATGAHINNADVARERVERLNTYERLVTNISADLAPVAYVAYDSYGASRVNVSWVGRSHVPESLEDVERAKTSAQAIGRSKELNELDVIKQSIEGLHTFPTIDEVNPVLAQISNLFTRVDIDRKQAVELEKNENVSANVSAILTLLSLLVILGYPTTHIVQSERDVKKYSTNPDNPFERELQKMIDQSK